MLRPATPLTVILLVAFVLLLLSVISTPIIKAIPLAHYQGIKYGVFGYCTDAGDCSKIQIGYATAAVFSAASDSSFTLPGDTRHTLSAILVIHPIAAFLTLVCLILAIAAHFHSPAHSPRFLLALLILTFPTLLVTLLAFLVDLLLFVPHLGWGGWIVLGATILIVAALVVTCAMRRTLVSRKARKRRIAENAEMNGANYYANRENNFGLVKAESPPNTAPGGYGDSALAVDKTGFATFESSSGPSNPMAGRRSESNEDRLPLDPLASGSTSAATTMTAAQVRSRSLTSDNQRPAFEDDPNFSSYPRGGMNGNVMRGAPNARGRGAPYGNYGGFQNSSQSSFGSNPPPGAMRGGMPPPGYSRGRGGYGPPRGGAPARAGYGWQSRGGYPPQRGGGPMTHGGRGGPPPNWNGRGGPQGMDMDSRRDMDTMDRAAGGLGIAAAGALAGAALADHHDDSQGQSDSRPTSPPGYDRNRFYQNRNAPPPPPKPQQVPSNELHFDQAAGPVGQAVEMDHKTGRQSSPTPGRPPMLLRDSDSDIQGFVGLQQQRQVGTGNKNEDTSVPGSPSIYSEYERSSYVPARANWGAAAQAPSPLNPRSGLAAIEASPVDQPPNQFDTITTATANGSRSRSQSRGSARGVTNGGPIGRNGPTPPVPGAAARTRSGSGSYYEDVDPRFAPVDERQSTVPLHQLSASPSPPLPAGRDDDSPFQNHFQPLQPRRKASLDSAKPRYDGAGYSFHSSTYDSSGLSTLEPVTQGQGAPGMLHPNPGHEGDENLPAGARSPGGLSDASHFTSVSQRGINPAWRPPPGSYTGFGPGPYGPPGPRSEGASNARARRPDMMDLSGPDFALPSSRVPQGSPGRSAGVPAARSPPAALGFSVDGPGRGNGRYPAAI